MVRKHSFGACKSSWDVNIDNVLRRLRKAFKNSQDDIAIEQGRLNFIVLCGIDQEGIVLNLSKSVIGESGFDDGFT